ncbi:hypothetical protein EPUL_003844 [Erysiphe pulchra]|uniref:Uncharacterized protein n=1 Tax=Erysiphe pulchra TaxID=225359 RepID=A0A2S4PU40_9PEZI|nr:hypothetical protein EPUL_003844 [Erysiphe pulchra]
MTDLMEISQESQAPSTESSHHPPPMPPVPPIPNSSPLIASLSSPSKIPPSNKIELGRQILKPVAPSKRPISERPLHNSWKNSDTANAFLPQELAEIIANRQRRDPNFAAADSSPPPPRVPIHTRPNKGNGNESNKGKIKDKNLSKIAVATPRIASNQYSNLSTSKEIELPRIIINNDRPWASVVRKGQKKARAVQNSNIHVTARNKESPRASHKDNSSTSRSDKRLFVRLPHDHEWRNLSPAGIREVIVKKLQISSSLIGKIKPVHSGFALSPCNTEARETILKVGNGLFLLGAKLEPATNLVPILIPTIPSSIRMEQGQVDVNNSMLADEIERVCLIRPAYLKLYGRNNINAPHRIWMVYFTKAPRSGFRALDESGIARPFKK